MGYTVIDTGGFETKDLYYQPFSKNIVWEQTEMAIQEADVVMMVFDGKAGLHPHDRQLVQYLKKIEKNVVYVTNKIDGVEQQSAMWEFFELGVDEVLTCSAAHNRGIWDLAAVIEGRLDQIKALAPVVDYGDAKKIASIGRPNAGKSSILNRLCGENRSLVSDVAGTTRDTVDTPLFIIRNNMSFSIQLGFAAVKRSSIRSKVSVLYEV